MISLPDRNPLLSFSSAARLIYHVCRVFQCSGLLIKRRSSGKDASGFCQLLSELLSELLYIFDYAAVHKKKSNYMTTNKNMIKIFLELYCGHALFIVKYVRHMHTYIHTVHKLINK